MVDAVISLAHSLGMRVVVECAERGSQLALLADRGCDDMQGDYFSPAVSAQRCTALLQENRALDISRLTRNAGSRTVLLLEQEGSAHVEALAALTATDRCRLFRAVDTHAAFSLLASHEVNVVVCDHTANGIDVIEFLRRVRQMYPKTVRIMLAAGDTRIAREAINIGAVFRYLPKPCLPETLVAAVNAAFTQCVA